SLVAGALRIRADREAPQLLGPEQWWQTKDAPVLYVRGAWHTRQWLALLTWMSPAGGFDGHGLTFPVIADGMFHTYRLELRRRHRGTVTGLRLDPVAAAELGGYVDVTCISWKP